MVKILNIQINPVIGNKKDNLQKIESFIAENSDKNPDLIVLPEFFSTGIDHNSFINSPEPVNGGDTIKFVSELAKKFNTNIVAGSVIEKENNKLYNTTFVINRNGNIVDKYRKIHLYNYMGGTEGERITAGDKIVVTDLDFGRIGLGICYDIRYPLHYKKLAKLGAEIIVLPTAWGVSNEIFEDKAMLKHAQELWIAINKTRAPLRYIILAAVNFFIN